MYLLHLALAKNAKLETSKSIMEGRGYLLLDKLSSALTRSENARIHSDFMAPPLSFTGFVWKNLKRRRLRTLLTLCGIGMAIGAFVGLVGFSRSFEQGWLSMYSSSGI